MKRFYKPLDFDNFKIVQDIVNGKTVIYEGSDYSALLLSDCEIKSYYEDFKRRVLKNMGINYFPIYRMADGEFGFIKTMFKIGPEKTIIDRYREVKSRLIFAVRPLKRYNRVIPISRWKFIKHLFDTQFYHVAHGECYTYEEISTLVPSYSELLEHVSRYGMLALHFLVSKHDCFSQDNEIILHYLEREGIQLTPINYIPFYFVYILFSEPGWESLFMSKNIMVISNLDQKKKLGIENTLHRLGVRSVDFINISPTNSLVEKITIPDNSLKYDLVLIGAGIGSLRVLYEARKLNTVCIDAGIILECLYDPNLRERRIFLKPSVAS